MNPKQELPHMGGATISSRLTSRLIQELRNGEFSQATRLPSEVELAEHYGVSRSVIRDVLSNLEGEGFVERGRGIGTLIHREIVELNNRLDLKFEYNNLVLGTGSRPETDSVRLYEKTAEEELADRLNVDEGSTVITCEKRILASGRPVIYSIDHLPIGLFGNIEYQMLDWSRPVFDLLEEYCGIVVDTDIANISATNGTAAIRGVMGLEEGEALLFIDEVGYYKLSFPVIQTYAYYTNFFDFTMLRKKY